MRSTLIEKQQIAQWLIDETNARAASDAATSPSEHDQHHIEAERCADRAWSLAETKNHTFVASKIWR